MSERIKTYKLTDLDMSISQFGTWRDKATGSFMKCMIEGCTKNATWRVNVKEENKSVLICFDHHDEASMMHLNRRRFDQALKETVKR